MATLAPPTANTRNNGDGNPAPRGQLAGPTLSRIEAEIRAGLPNEQERLGHALANLEFYEGDFSRHPVRPPGASYDQYRYSRHTLIMQRVIKTLTSNLYKAGPDRKLPFHPEAELWLANVYRRLLVDALWQQADRLSMVSDVAAFQVVGDIDPDCPVKIHLWDSSCFNVWVHPDDPCQPIAVATIDRYDEQTRVRLWTADVVQTWLSEKLKEGQTAGGRTLRFESELANPYGCLPFCFVHVELPTRHFWTGGFGTHLANVNDYTNFFLTEHSDCVRYNTRPVVVLKGVRPGWRPPTPIQPGDVWDLPADTGDEASNQARDASAEYLQAETGFIQAGWDDCQQYLDHVLEMVGVPPSTIRMEQRSAMSGVAFVAEQIPLILWAMGRQRPFAKYEDCLAKLVLTVGSKHLANNAVSSAALEAAAADPGLVLRWPDMFPDLPGPDRDTADQWLLDNGMTSRTQILMRREHLTHPEAQARLEEIAEDLEIEHRILGAATQAPDPTLPKPKPADDDEDLEEDPGGEPEDEDPDDDDDDELDDDEDDDS